MDIITRKIAYVDYSVSYSYSGYPTLKVSTRISENIHELTLCLSRIPVSTLPPVPCQTLIQNPDFLYNGQFPFFGRALTNSVPLYLHSKAFIMYVCLSARFYICFPYNQMHCRNQNNHLLQNFIIIALAEPGIHVMQKPCTKPYWFPTFLYQIGSPLTPIYRWRGILCTEARSIQSCGVNYITRTNCPQE